MDRNKIKITAFQVSSELRKYKATGHIDLNVIHKSYSLIKTCRYILDPNSYSKDVDAIEDANIIISAINKTPHDIQIIIRSVNVVVDDLLKGVNVCVDPAIIFFYDLGKALRCSESSLSA
jgi:hypothetical protein